MAISALAGLTVGLTLLKRRAPEDVSSFKGKTLREWLLQVYDPISGNSQLERQKAFIAFREMGSNAAPFLTEIFTSEDTKLTKHFAVVYRAAYFQARPGLRRQLPELVTAEDIRTAGREVCSHLPPEQLRTIADQVVPGLCKRALDKSRSGVERENLLLGLIRDLQPRAALVKPTLIAALQDREINVRRAAAFLCMEYGEQMKDAAPELLKALADSDSELRLSSVCTLSTIGRLSDVSLPVLRRALDDPYFRSVAADALEKLARNNGLELDRLK